MFGSTVLEVAISVIFIYILLSLLCSTINEQVIVRILSLRAQVLEEGILNMLGDPALVKLFYDHPLIQSLSQNMQYSVTTKQPVQITQANYTGVPTISTPSSYIPTSISAFIQKYTGLLQPKSATGTPVVHKPSYIPANIFALALRDVLIQPRTSVDPTTAAALADLEVILQMLHIDLAKDLTGMEVWFNSTMDRVSGWYKRRVQLFIFVLGLIAAFSLNIDTISLITTISHDTTVRATLVSAAQGYTTQHDPNLNALVQNLNQIQPLIGWYSAPDSFAGWLLKIIGLLATTFAISLGAPFWFDILNKLVALRSSGPPPAPGPGSANAATPALPQEVMVVQRNTPPNPYTNISNIPSVPSMPGLPPATPHPTPPDPYASVPPPPTAQSALPDPYASVPPPIPQDAIPDPFSSQDTTEKRQDTTP